MKPGTLGEEMAAMADGLPAQHPDRALWAARGYAVEIVRRLAKIKSHSFSKGCKLFVKHTLPEVATAPELADLNRILRFAGFGDGDNGKITAPMLRDWERETRIPDVADIDQSSGFMTAEEYTSLSRAGIIADLPKTVRGMRKYLETAAASTGDPDRFRRRVP